jgi:pimeloyl-ACP methyl ester carboxylesterase
MMLTVGGGRRLEVFPTPGPGVPLILCHGTPGCGMLADDWSAACAARGLRLVGYSRPGYGESTRFPGRSVADAVADVEAVASALGAERFYVLGHSGGGSHALACAALLPRRVIATAVIAAAAPRSAAGLDWFAGQLEENIAEFRAAEAGGEALRVLLEEWRTEMLAGPDDGEADPTAALASFISAADRASITPASAAFAASRQRHALAPGIWGWYDDDLTETRCWGFEPASIAGPVAVWHGGQDLFVPQGHGRWLASTIPGARVHLLVDEGHFSLFGQRFGLVLDDLVSLASPAPSR